MNSISLTEAKARLSELVDRAAAGERLAILRHGKHVADLVPAVAPRKPVDIERLKAVSAMVPPLPDDAEDTIRRLRDEARY